ncbi:hypothetical protein Hanom_Chr16g01446681 [Helianthus anomalus]
MNTYLGFVLVGTSKSSKPVSRFSVADLQDIASPKSQKKELATSSSKPEPKGMSTRGKGAKKRKTVEPTEGLPVIAYQLHEYVSEVRNLYPEVQAFLSEVKGLCLLIFSVQKFVEVQILLDQHLAEAEQKNLNFQQIFLAKDKNISSVERDVNLLQKVLVLTQIMT